MICYLLFSQTDQNEAIQLSQFEVMNASLGTTPTNCSVTARFSTQNAQTNSIMQQNQQEPVLREEVIMGSQQQAQADSVEGKSVVLQRAFNNITILQELHLPLNQGNELSGLGANLHFGSELSSMIADQGVNAHENSLSSGNPLIIHNVGSTSSLMQGNSMNNNQIETDSSDEEEDCKSSDSQKSNPTEAPLMRSRQMIMTFKNNGAKANQKN